MNTTIERKIDEWNELKADGVEMPYPILEMVFLEEIGGIVDIETGNVTFTGEVKKNDMAQSFLILRTGWASISDLLINDMRQNDTIGGTDYGEFTMQRVDSWIICTHCSEMWNPNNGPHVCKVRGRCEAIS